MKFGKSIGSQQDSHGNLHYVDYKLLKKRIKDVVGYQRDHDLAEALTANSVFEEDLAKEIRQVNGCFSDCQRDFLTRTSCLSEQLHTQGSSGDQCVASSSTCQVPDASLQPRQEHFRTLVGILREVDKLRQYAVWNAVAVVKILKKRRKHTNFGLEDTAAERAGWLARQSFFSGSDFAELHAAVESLGHMLVLTELGPGRTSSRLDAARKKELHQCPICLDEISDMVELSCNHRFCWKCFVLGPIAHQPGEYRITQCPICRKETAQSEGDFEGGDSADPETVCMQSSKGMLTRFLHTYFPEQDNAKEDFDGDDEDDEDFVKMPESQSGKEARNVVGELVKALLADTNWQRTNLSDQDSGIPQQVQDSMVAGADDFFQTLPPQKAPEERQAISAAQKLQWVQLASNGDPFAIDDASYCSLCSEPLIMEAVVTTPCKHHFHRVCIKRVDMPHCPLCSTLLPMAWFLPEDHPCCKNGFRVIPTQKYRPEFPGGPSKGSCGYPLRNPPPVNLRTCDGHTMKSYLHKVLPSGGHVGSDSPSANATSPTSMSPQFGPMAPDEAASSASESSSDDSEGSDEGCGINFPGSIPARRSKEKKIAYGALGRMKLLTPCAASTPRGSRLS